MTEILRRHRMLMLLVATALLMVICCEARAEGLTLMGRPVISEQIKREQAIIDGANMKEWPQSDRLTVAPIVDSSFLSKNTIVTRQSRSYDNIVLDDADCGRVWIKWDKMVPSDVPLPTELPAARRASLEKRVKHLPDDERKRFFDKKLKRLRASKAYVLKGSLSVKMVVAPSSRAAQEWLVYTSTQCSLPTEAIVQQFAKSRRVDGVGDLAFKIRGQMMLTRGNVAVIVRGDGDLESEVVPLAAKIDAAIAKEPVLMTLRSRRPTVAFGALRRKSVRAPGQPGQSFTVTAPAGHKVAYVQAIVNGEHLPVKNGEVLFGSTRGKVALKMHVITDRLLVTSIDKDILVDAK